MTFPVVSSSAAEQARGAIALVIVRRPLRRARAALATLGAVRSNAWIWLISCVDVGFLPEGILDQLPAPSQVAGTRIGGIAMNIPRVRAALAAALSLAVAPAGFTVTQFTAQVRAMTGQTPDGYSTRQGAYDLRKLRGKQLVIKPGRTRRYHVPGDAARIITALLTVRDKLIAPLISRNPHTTTRPATQALDPGGRNRRPSP